MSLKIFADLMSQPSRAVVLFCRAAKVPHELKPIMLKKGEHMTEEMTKINPFQKVPFAEHNGIPLVESLAIMRYITNTHSLDEHWYPKNDPLAQQKVEEYLHWQHINTRAMCAKYFQEKWLIPTITQKPPIERKVASFQRGMEKVLDQIETIWLENGQKKYICGDKISVADIVACCELEQPSMAGYDVTEGRPVLKEYMTRVKSELQPHYDDVHKIVYQMCDKFGGKIPGLEIQGAKL